MCCFQVLEASDGPLMYQLKHLGAAECHLAYRMVVVMMRRDMPMPKVAGSTETQYMQLLASCTACAITGCSACLSARQGSLCNALQPGMIEAGIDRHRCCCARA
jgi:hypothetical protein